MGIWISILSMRIRISICRIWKGFLGALWGGLLLIRGWILRVRIDICSLRVRFLISLLVILILVWGSFRWLMSMWRVLRRLWWLWRAIWWLIIMWLVIINDWGGEMLLKLLLRSCMIIFSRMTNYRGFLKIHRWKGRKARWLITFLSI